MNVLSIFLQITWLKTLWSVRMLLKRSPHSTKMFLRALRYWRVLEFPYVLSRLRGKKNLQVLDISSPKILSLYIAEYFGHEVTAIDIWDKEIRMWTEINGSLALFPHDGPHFKLETQDATHLAYEDKSFDFVYSISVFEHIDNHGDTMAMKEIARVLKDGGIAVITTMFDKTGYDVWRKENVYNKQFSDSAVFYERWYNWAQIHERLILPSGLELLDITFAREKFVRVHKKYLDRFISSTFVVSNSWSIVEPFIALLNLGYCAKPDELDEGIALITLKKSQPIHESGLSTER